MKNKKTKVDIAYIGRYNESEKLSGPEKTAKRIFSMASAKHKAVFIQNIDEGEKYSLNKRLFGLEEYITGNNLKIYSAGSIRLFLLLFKLKPKLIHVISFDRFASFAVYYAKIKKIKIIYNSHGVITHVDSFTGHDKTRHSNKDKKTERMLIDKCSNLIFPSEAAKELCKKYYNLENAIIHIIPNGIDSVFHNALEKYKREAVVFLSGGTLHKSGREFLKKYLSKPHTGLNLYIIGDKNYFTETNEYGIFKFESMESIKLAEFYRDKDIFMALNEFDTFSISAAEAMASGLIPIVTKQTGISSLVFNDVNGYVIDYGDTGQLQQSLEKIRKKDNVNKEILRNNSKAIYHKLNWDEVYKMYENIYSIN